MGKLSVCASFVFVLAACGSSSKSSGGGADAPGTGIDAKVFMDAPGPYSCLGDSAPTTANANVTLSGTVNELTVTFLPTISATMTPLQGASVDACTGDCMSTNQLATTMTDAGGAFSLGPLATGGTPLNAYAQMTYTGDVPVLAYAAVPITADVPGVPMITLKTTTLAELRDLCANTTTDGLAIVIVTDCTGKTITDDANITITAQQNGSNVTGVAITDLGKLTSTAAGLFLVCQLPAMTTTLGAKYMNMTFLSHDVNIVGGTVTETEIQPGY